MHNQTISWNDNWTLIFVCLVGRLLLVPSASSSSSFTTASFLIQMMRWIRGSSWVESFIFLITWGIFFESWEIDLQFLPYSPKLNYPCFSPIFSSLIMSRASSCVHSSQSPLKVINFLLAQIPWMNESHVLERPFKEAIKIPFSSFTAL